MKESTAGLDEPNNDFGDDFDDFEEGAEAGMDDDFGDFDDGFEEPAIAEEAQPQAHDREQELPLLSFVSRNDLTMLMTLLSRLECPDNIHAYLHLASNRLSVTRILLRPFSCHPRPPRCNVTLDNI